MFYFILALKKLNRITLELSELCSYATRVKAITNNAQRNVESKEIAQLKEVHATFTASYSNIYISI